jgi:uncharacterized phiE125 gp8 family phage protein
MTVATLKSELKVEVSTDDTILGYKLAAAERFVEEYTNRRLMKAVYDLTLSDWPAGGITLPFSPVLSIDSIKYYDGDNTLQTWAATNYYYNVNQEPCMIYYVNATPSLRDNRQDCITVRFTVGYSSAAETATQQAAVPDGIKQAIVKIAGDLYHTRHDAVRERFTAWQMMAYPYRVFHMPNSNE